MRFKSFESKRKHSDLYGNLAEEGCVVKVEMKVSILKNVSWKMNMML
jgi:hypothetical protein